MELIGDFLSVASDHRENNTHLDPFDIMVRYDGWPAVG